MGIKHRAREVSLQLLYQLEFFQVSEREACMAEFWRHFRGGAEVRRLAEQIISGVFEFCSEIDALISRSSVRWRVDRLSLVDRNIMRIAIFELLHQKETPPKVAINEAIEITKTFSQPSAASFVNGVLDRIYKDLVVRDSSSSPADHGLTGDGRSN